MNDLILTKMREGDWGAVVRLMREEREGSASTAVAELVPDSGHPMPFKERFDTVLRECMTSPHHSSKEMDFAFFRMMVESGR